MHGRTEVAFFAIMNRDSRWGRWCILPFVVLAYVLAPLTIQLTFVPASEWLSTIAQINGQVTFDYFASQSLLLVALVLVTSRCLRNDRIPVLMIITCSGLVAPIHGLISNLIMFVAQYNRAFLSGQAVIAAIISSFVILAIAQAHAEKDRDSGEPSDAPQERAARFENGNPTPDPG